MPREIFLCAADQLSANGFGTVVDIDTKGTFNVCRAAFEALKESKGQIFNISATLHYLATPYADTCVRRKSRSRRDHPKSLGRMGPLRHPRQRHRPGPIEDTEGMRRLVPPEVKDKIARKIPIGRYGQIEDIENAAFFLCSDAASFINGVTLVVDGGHWLSVPASVDPWKLSSSDECSSDMENVKCLAFYVEQDPIAADELTVSTSGSPVFLICFRNLEGIAVKNTKVLYVS